MKRSREESTAASSKRSRWNIWPFANLPVDKEVCPAPKTLAETIKNSNVGRFQSAVRPILKLLGMSEQIKLPKIVFCGQESSGKSSTVERAANLAFTPRNASICTRQPIFLECVHAENTDTSLTLETPMGAQVIDLAAAQGALEEAVKKAMFLGPGIDEEALTLTYTSPEIPTMSFCDLPGTIGVTKAGEPLDLKERTVELLKETIEDRNALLCCVVTADVRNNIALETLQKTPGALDRTIVVLAKADTLLDSKYKSKGKGSASWKLEQMLLTSPIDGYRGTIVPVVNRDTATAKQASIKQVNAREQAWFKKHMPELDTESDCSIRAVINGFDRLYTQHMQRVWIPEFSATITAKNAVVVRQIKDLGTEPSKIERAELYLWFRNVLQRLHASCIQKNYSLPSNPADAAAKELRAVVSNVSGTEITRTCSMFLVAKRRSSAFKNIAALAPQLAAIHAQRFLAVLELSFNEDHYAFNIKRFEQLKKRCAQKLKLALKKASKSYLSEIYGFLKYFETAALGVPTINFEVLYGAELHIATRCFALALDDSTDVYKPEFVLPANLIENCAAQRTRLNKRVETLKQAMNKLDALKAIN